MKKTKEMIRSTMISQHRLALGMNRHSEKHIPQRQLWLGTAVAILCLGALIAVCIYSLKWNMLR